MTADQILRPAYAAEIISQFMNIDETQELTNAVFMGMGSRWTIGMSLKGTSNTYFGLGFWLEPKAHYSFNDWVLPTLRTFWMIPSAIWQ